MGVSTLFVVQIYTCLLYTSATRPHDRPVTASPASKTDTGKMQEVKRPVTTDKVHTEPTKAQPVKERPLASGTEKDVYKRQQ